jgi:ABC-type amino acid transport substrate-binding protein
MCAKPPNNFRRDRPATAALRAAIAAALMCLCGTASAQTPTDALLQRELVVGTKEAAPFAMKNADGVWIGISIDLWRRIAEEKKIRYRLVETETVPQLIEGVAAGKFDVAVAALTVTAAREEILDFSAPFYTTGLGIAVASGGLANWAPVFRALTSLNFLQSVFALIGLALLVGLVVWLFERRSNEEFGGSVARGLSSSVWWTTVAMTQRGIGQAGPRTMPGRFVAMLWMVGSIIALAVFTAGITSAITVRQLQGNVQGVTDLSQVKVGAVAGSSTEEALARIRTSFTPYPNARDGLQALRARQIDAFVYDRPLMAWIVSQDFRSSIQILDATFDPQNYAFAMPPGSPLRKSLNVAILHAVQSRWWDDTLFRYIGSR